MQMGWSSPGVKDNFICMGFAPLQACSISCTSCDSGREIFPRAFRAECQPALSSGSDICWPRLHSGISPSVRLEHNLMLAANASRGRFRCSSLCCLCLVFVLEWSDSNVFRCATVVRNFFLCPAGLAKDSLLHHHPADLSFERFDCSRQLVPPT
jgi:hypothetical protein